MRQAIWLFLTILSLVTLASSNRTPVCLQAEVLYRAACLQTDSTSGSLQTAQGAPGKRGPSGQKGDTGRRGANGHAAVVDYDKVDSLIHDKIQEAFGEYKTTINELIESLERANERVQSLESREGICGVKHDGKCFWLEIRYDSQPINYEEGRRICSARGGTPANIYSEEHYGEITRYIRAQMPEGFEIFTIWLGMRTDVPNRRITLSDGSPAPFLKWNAGYPLWRSDYTHMAMSVRNPLNNLYRDMYDYSPTSTRYGVLCQI